MSHNTIRRTVKIQNPAGFHIRQIGVFVKTAATFKSAVFVYKDTERLNGKSSMELLVLAAEAGTELTLEVTGPDAQAASDALTAVLAAASDDELGDGQ